MLCYNAIFHFHPHFHYNLYNLIKTEQLFFANYLEHLILVLNDSMDEESEQFLNSKSSASGCC